MVSLKASSTALALSTLYNTVDYNIMYKLWLPAQIQVPQVTTYTCKPLQPSAIDAMAHVN